MKIRRKYYDFFSKFYDKFIKLHSRDKNEKLRKFFVNQIKEKDEIKILDLCCGTGSNFIHFEKKFKHPFMVGIDFSYGMLSQAKTKNRNAFLILADIENLPFKNEIFDVSTYTYAFYELKSEKVHNALSEIKRVLKSNGKLLIMEHEIPENFFIKFLYYIRLASMGLSKAKMIISHEQELLSKYFSKVEKVLSKSKKSKIFICLKKH